MEKGMGEAREPSDGGHRRGRCGLRGEALLEALRAHGGTAARTAIVAPSRALAVTSRALARTGARAGGREDRRSLGGWLEKTN